jgi:hypothetical protein
VLLSGSVWVFWIPNHLLVLIDGVSGESGASVNRSRKLTLVVPCPNHRHCSSYENVIWYHSKQKDMAGLDDHRQILNSFGNLAGSLCARLAVSSPKRLLGAERHNTLVPPTLHWAGLINLTPISMIKMIEFLLVCFGKFGMHNNNYIRRSLTTTPTLLLLDNHKTCSLLSYGFGTRTAQNALFGMYAFRGMLPPRVCGTSRRLLI